MTTLSDALMLKGGGVISLAGAGGKTSLMFRLARELSARGDTVLTTTTTKILRPSADQSPSVIISDSIATVLERAACLLKVARHVTAACAEKGPEKLVGFSAPMIDRLFQARRFRWILVEADGASRMPLKAPADHEPVIPESTGWHVGVVGLDAVGLPLATPPVFRPERYAAITGIRPGMTVTAASIADALSHPRGIMKNSPSTALRLIFLNKADSRRRLAHGLNVADALSAKGDHGLDRVIIGSARGQTAVQVYSDL